MLSLFTPLLLLLAVPTLTNAAVFVPFDYLHISLSYGSSNSATNPQAYQNVPALQACIDLANARTGGRGPTGYFYKTKQFVCTSYTV